MTDPQQSNTLLESITIGDQGNFWVNINHTPTEFGTAVSGQMYVEYQIPKDQLHPYPLVLVHGGGAQGTDFLGTPDGRTGWATHFLQKGYAVYVVDRPGHGRSPMNSDVLGAMSPSPAFEMIVPMFTAPDPKTAFWPMANLATRWPGEGTQGDPILDQFMASQGPILMDMTVTESLMKKASAALLDKIGPAILLTHSSGSPFGWLAANERPDLVKGIVAVEPLGPPFSDQPGGLGPLSWGITATPLSYEPACESAEDLAQGAYTVPAFKDTPMVVVTSESSAWNLFDPATVDVLTGLGAQVEHLRLAEIGIHGNGHMMMLETNNDEIATALDAWLVDNVKS